MYPIEKYINWTLDSFKSGRLSHSLTAHTSPRRYLQYAQEELDQPQSNRTLINALGHAKRAIHLQTDITIDALRMNNLVSKNFPAKIDVFQQCGIVAPRILKRLNQLRNAVEHDYEVPSRQVVEDAVDIGLLFVEATHNLLQSFPLHVVLESNCREKSAKLYIQFSVDEGALKICQCGPPPAGDVFWSVKTTDNGFAPWLQLLRQLVNSSIH